MLYKRLEKITVYSFIWIISLCAFGCDSTEDKDTNEGRSTPEAGFTAGDNAIAGDTTGPEAGEVAAGAEVVAGVEAGEAAGEETAAGASAGGEVVAGAEAGETAGEETAAGESAGDQAGDEAGDEVIIEVSGELAEEWVDPEDFGAPGEGIHAFTMVDINGEEVDMRLSRDRVVLVVNVASRCGYTSQYEDLQSLYDMYRERGLVILGFPANNFGGQEPGTDEEIAEFCSANYGVTFPLFSKISVKGGDIDPLYEYLTGESGREVSWNFNKFLVGTDGMYIEQFLSPVAPLSEELIGVLEENLPQE